MWKWEWGPEVRVRPKPLQATAREGLFQSHGHSTWTEWPLLGLRLGLGGPALNSELQLCVFDSPGTGTLVVSSRKYDYKRCHFLMVHFEKV